MKGEKDVVYIIEFYQDKDGKSEIEEYIQQLQNRPNKDNRIRREKQTAL